MSENYVFSERYSHHTGLSEDEKAEISALFRTYADRWNGFGLTHYFYRTVYVCPKLGEIENCDLMFGPAEWIEMYYDQDLGAMFSAICQSQPNYAVAFPKITQNFVTDKQREVIEKTIHNGMFYDFFYQFRDSPMSGGGMSGGRRNEMLSKPALYATLGSGIEFHKKVGRFLGDAAERKYELTDNELKYLHLLFYGLSQRDIATESGVTRNWVAKTCMNMRRKLDVTSDAGAVAKAVGLQILR